LPNGNVVEENAKKGKQKKREPGMN